MHPGINAIYAQYGSQAPLEQSLQVHAWPTLATRCCEFFDAGSGKLSKGWESQWQPGELLTRGVGLVVAPADYVWTTTQQTTAKPK